MIAAYWTPDCQGKQDFDGPIIEINTRYWPESWIDEFDTIEGWVKVKSKPSAHSEIILRDREEDHDKTIIDGYFVAETEDEVKKQVEDWANKQHRKMVDLMNILREHLTEG